MGEVYRARDTTLKRDVALKVLPADFANNSERMARFQREAEVLASLDHPNIGQIHGICEGEGTRALALALVESLMYRVFTKKVIYRWIYLLLGARGGHNVGMPRGESHLQHNGWDRSERRPTRGSDASRNGHIPCVRQ